MYLSTASVGPMVFEKKVLKDGKYTMSAQGMPQEAEATDKEEINEDAAFFTEAYMMKQSGYNYTVGGIEDVNGKEAYALIVKSPAGREYTNYYDKTTGLKVKNTTVEEAGPGKKITVQTYFSEYKNFNGIQIPTKILVDQGPMKIDMNFNDIKVNSGVKADEIM